jgi:peptidoglycan hydrolase CwlO-like protein
MSPAPTRRASSTLLACALAFAALCDSTALGQTAELDQVRERQEQIRDQLAVMNEEVDALIGRVAELRRREDAVAQELADAEARLATTKQELTGARDELVDKREELAGAVVELEDVLVDIYKSGSSDLIDVMLGASSYDEMIAEADYFEMVQDYQSGVIERVRELRAETKALVAELEGKVGTLTEARDEIAARHAELAASRADLEAEEAELLALRQERRDEILALNGREETLVEALTPPAPAGDPDGSGVAPAPAPTTSGSTATLNSDGTASAPADAPPAVQSAIAAANAITNTPYYYGGGHGSFESSGYDCSGSLSYMLHGGGFLDSPLDSTGLMTWGEPGPGAWITVYSNPGHAFAVVAGLRYDTSGAPPRWQTEMRDTSGYVATHPPGY